VSRGSVVGPDGVRVMAAQCATCIFRAGNPMRLRPGRVRQMVADCLSGDGHIVCHDTLGHRRAAICRGFWDSYGHRVTICQLAQRLSFWVPHIIEEEQ
jgi:hypothetical protein